MMKEMMSTAKGLDTFFKVLQKVIWITALVVLCVLAVLTVTNAINPNAVIGTGLNEVELGTVKLTLAAEQALSNKALLIYGWISGGIMACFAGVVYAGLRILRMILAPMAEGRPFHPETAGYIKKLAWLSLTFGIVQNVAASLEATVALHSFGIKQLLESGVIEAVSINYTFDCSFLVVFFLLLLVSYIFSYGAKLQALSDETV